MRRPRGNAFLSRPHPPLSAPVSALARGVLASLQAATYKSGSPGSLAALLESPAGLSRAAVLLDELAPQGVPETTDPDTLHSGVSLTVPVSDS